MAFLVAENRLSSGGTDLPGPGIKPMFPALSGGFLPTGPSGKFLYISILHMTFRYLHDELRKKGTSL